MSAGFDPQIFWGLTFRLYDLHMRGAHRRIQREIEVGNRQAHNIASLTAAASVGKLPAFDKVFPRQSQTAGARVAQTADVLTANLQALARAWGASQG